MKWLNNLMCQKRKKKYLFIVLFLVILSFEAFIISQVNFHKQPSLALKPQISETKKCEIAKDPTIETSPYALNDAQIKRLAETLPALKKKAPPLLPISQKNEMPIRTASNRCYFKEQHYSPGDIVKTEQGWIRCTPTINFSISQENIKEGAAVWIDVK